MKKTTRRITAGSMKTMMGMTSVTGMRDCQRRQADGQHSGTWHATRAAAAACSKHCSAHKTEADERKQLDHVSHWTLFVAMYLFTHCIPLFNHVDDLCGRGGWGMLQRIHRYILMVAYYGRCETVLHVL